MHLSCVKRTSIPYIQYRLIVSTKGKTIILCVRSPKKMARAVRFQLNKLWRQSNIRRYYWIIDKHVLKRKVHCLNLVGEWKPTHSCSNIQVQKLGGEEADTYVFKRGNIQNYSDLIETCLIRKRKQYWKCSTDLFWVSNSLNLQIAGPYENANSESHQNYPNKEQRIENCRNLAMRNLSEKGSFDFLSCFFVHIGAFMLTLFNWPLFSYSQDILKGLPALFRESNQAYASFSPFQALSPALPLLPRCTFSSCQNLGDLTILAFSLWSAIATHRQYVNIMVVSLYDHTKRDVLCQPQQNLDKKEGNKSL